MFTIFNLELYITGLNIKNWFSRKPKFTKETAHILFVDDDEFPVVTNLKNAGWSVGWVKDIQNLQDEELARSQIVFIDYKGVGLVLSEDEQGIGLIRAIKNTYGNKKRVILYSAYGRFKLDMGFREADNQMSKNSNTYEFISMIESEIKKLK